MQRPTPGPVLQRESVRASRRRRTYVMRTAYTALLFTGALTLLDQWTGYGVDHANFTIMGRQLFGAYTTLALWAVCLLTPLLVAAGVQEEREAKTLDLLVLTGLSPGRVLLDQIAARLMVLLLTLLAGVPFLGLILGFGGFGIVEILTSTLAAMCTALILANFAAHTALVVRGGPLMSLALAMPYTFFVLVLPALMVILQSRGRLENEPYVVSPLLAMFGDEPLVLASLVPWSVALVLGWTMTTACFRIVAGGDEADGEFGLLSPDIWVVERFRRGTWFAAAVLLFVSLPYDMLLLSDAIPRQALAPLAWAYCSTMVVVFHCLALVLTQHAGEWLDRWMSSSFRLRFGAARWDTTRTRELRGPPLMWRALATRSAGPVRWFPILVCVGLVGIIGLSRMLERDVFTEAVALIMFAILASLGAWLTATLVGTSIALSERRARSVALLLMTRLRPRQIAGQLASSAVLAALVPFGIAAGMYMVAGLYVDDSYTSRHDHHHHDWGPHVGGGWLLQLLGWSAWHVLVMGNLALLATWIGLFVKPIRMAWPVSLMAGMTYLWGPVFALLVLDELRIDVDDALEVALAWMPYVSETSFTCADGGLAPELLMGILFQAAATVVLLGLASRRIRRMAVLK